MATLFGWMNPIFRVGARTALELDDLPSLEYHLGARFNLIKLQQAWQKQSLPLLLVLVRCFWKQALFTATLAMLNALALYLAPFLVYMFVAYLDQGSAKSKAAGWLLVSGFLGSQLLEMVSERNYFFRSQVLSLRVRSALGSLVYSKGLRLSSTSRLRHSGGEMINYLSSDVESVSGFFWYLHAPWVVLLHVSLALVVLHRSLGWVAFPGVAAMLLGAGLNALLGRFQEERQKSVARARDKRMNSTMECLKNMKALKLFCWEHLYLDKLLQLRNHEFGLLKALFFIQDVARHLSWSFPMLIALVTFAACTLLGVPLAAQSVLSALATFQILQTNLQDLSSFIPALAQAKVSLARLSVFLHEEELLPRPPCQDSASAITIRGGTFSWEQSRQTPTLADLDVEIEQGSLLCVSGPVGSGKSSLLSCILGEMPRLAGKVQVRGSVAYVPQVAWLVSATVEDNILFGKQMNRTKYDKTLQACQLNKDLEMLQFGDQTLIGANLSGGQKHRIQLARAVYQDADVYLIDDVFSALDADTRSSVLKECVYGVLKSKTIVLATQRPEMLGGNADAIMVLANGRVSTWSRQEPTSSSKAAAVLGEEPGEESGGRKTKAQSEDRKRGAVSLQIFRMYLWPIRAWVCVVLAAHAGFQLVQMFGTFWFASSFTVSNSSSSSILRWYTLLLVASSALLAARVLLVSRIGLVAAQTFFEGMLQSIFHAPMSFFDTTPSGRILTRASSDQTSLDVFAPQRLGGVAFSAIELAVVLVIMSQVPLVLVFLLPVIAASIWLQRYYAASIRELPRLIAIQQALVTSHFVQSMAGAPVIRAFRQQERFVQQNHMAIDKHGRTVYYNFAAMECMALHIGLLLNVVLAVFMLATMTFPRYTVNIAYAGVALTYALKLNSIQRSLVWDICDAEKRIISAERIKQYIGIAREAEWQLKGSPTSWPSNGDIELKNLQVRYDLTGPLILKGITCRLVGGHKVSVMGRTGSGKSTLVQCLFRIVEPGRGQFFIDGVDITSVGLHDLRTKMRIIPQEPIMFQGSVRHNLDPLGKHGEDSGLWEVLEKCHLDKDVSQRPLKLDSPVWDDAENWSVGQRQLFCLARMLLDKESVRIVVLDEATSLRHRTFDALVRKEFKGCTTINVTHHLDSIGSSDMVLVLADGQISEYTSPEKLSTTRFLLDL